MREIKFRAWDPEHNAMHSSEDAGLDWLFGLVARHGATVMQYTGLKDKNGKEIYEGDILSFEMTRTVPVDHPVMVAFHNEVGVYQGPVKWGEYGWRPFTDGATSAKSEVRAGPGNLHRALSGISA